MGLREVLRNLVLHEPESTEILCLICSDSDLKKINRGSASEVFSALAIFAFPPFEAYI
jgi:hypothetical protein